MFNKEILSEIEKKIVVSENPFPNAIIEKFFPLEVAKEAEEEFKNYNTTNEAGVRGAEHFQKTKRFSNRYEDMPYTIKKIIDFLYSKNFINILEKKFNLKNVEPDWSFHGGGLHESFNGGFLKIHSDFIYMRESKLRRVLNLLLYLNSNWQKNWGGSIELWDKEMKSARKSVLPEINKAVIFRTDKVSNHGFPEPIRCPDNITRKSIALYYYIIEKTILPRSIRRRKYYHAVWKKRPNIDEPKFGDFALKDKSFFRRIKEKFFYFIF